MKLDFDGKGMLLNPKEFETFEKSTGCKLPESYKQFLIKQNGGVIKTRYEIDGEEASLTHKIILPDCQTIYLNITELSDFPAFDDEEGINRYHLYNDKGDPNYKYDNPYDIDEYGNYGIQLVIADSSDYKTTTLCLSPEENYGKVYVFDDHGGWDETYQNCAKVSDSFEEFMNTFILMKISEM